MGMSNKDQVIKIIVCFAQAFHMAQDHHTAVSPFPAPTGLPKSSSWACKQLSSRHPPSPAGSRKTSLGSGRITWLTPLSAALTCDFQGTPLLLDYWRLVWVPQQTLGGC